MQDAPSSADLLRSVSQFIRTRAMPELAGRDAFHARVAGNVLDIITREVELGPAADAAELQRLNALLGVDVDDLRAANAELSDRIRSRDLDITEPRLVAHLKATVTAKIAIDQPTYSTYRKWNNEQ